MPLPLLQVARLLGQLTVIGPVVTEGVDKIRQLVETIRKNDGNTTTELDALKQTVELQSAVNKKVDDELRLIGSVLRNVQKSLRMLALATAASALVALAALALALLN